MNTVRVHVGTPPFRHGADKVDSVCLWNKRYSRPPRVMPTWQPGATSGHILERNELVLKADCAISKKRH